MLLAAIAAWGVRMVGAIADADALISAARIVFIILFVLIAARIARYGDRRPLALATMLVTATALFINELSRLGVPDIWFPFNIGVTLTQYAYATVILCVPFLLADREKTASPR